jgi:phospholipase C
VTSFQFRTCIVAAAVLPSLIGCGSGAVTPASPSYALPASEFAAIPIKGSPIQHVIVVIQENRTTDNLFASSILTNGRPYPGANVTQTAKIDGKSIRLRSTPFEAPGDPSHTHASLLAEWDNGKMNGFPHDNVYGYSGKIPADFTISYVPAYETTVYHLLAQQYALADENFSPRLVPTFPGHMFLVAGQSPPADDPFDPGSYASNWGCDSAAGTMVALFNPRGEGEQSKYVFPCFDYRTIADLMDRAKVSWKYYTGAVGNAADGNGTDIYDAIEPIRRDPSTWKNVVSPPSNVLSDIQNCRLPQVSYVTPTWMDSDHAGDLSNGGPGWVGTIYNAIVQSTYARKIACRYYANTALILTWDDSGGWYDHVKPPHGPNATTWGFRVPLIVISTWARSSYGGSGSAPFVSHTVRESTAILRYIERNWGLGNLGQRDASGDDLSDMFDYTRKTPVPPISAFVIRAAIHRTDFNLSAIPRDTHVVDDDR